MARIDLIRSINKGVRILGKEVRKFPESYHELAQMNEDVWRQVGLKKRKM